MGTITGERISRLIERNTAEYFLSLGRLNNSEVCDTPEVKSVIVALHEYRIFMANFSAEDASPGIERIVSRLEELKIPALWYVTPFSCPAGLGELLNEHGFTYQKDWTSMAMDMMAFREDNNPPPGLEICEVWSSGDLRNWADVLVESFGIEESIKESYKSYFTGPGAGNGMKWRYYLGRLNGKPVATGVVFYGKEAAGIYWVGTLKEARGKGIGMAMTMRLLKEAKNNGYGICILNASQMGRPLYKKIGFSEYYTTNIYKWGPTSR